MNLKEQIGIVSRLFKAWVEEHERYYREDEINSAYIKSVADFDSRVRQFSICLNRESGTATALENLRYIKQIGLDQLSSISKKDLKWLLENPKHRLPNPRKNLSTNGPAVV